MVKTKTNGKKENKEVSKEKSMYRRLCTLWHENKERQESAELRKEKIISTKSKDLTTIQKSRNVHYINMDAGVKSMRYLLISDLHWDNPHCDRKLLRKHLQQAKDCGAKVVVNGDIFCLMQGKADPRRIKSDIRPEHNNAKYFDSIVETAAEWFAPFADCIELVGYGNHETSIIRHQETDILQRFVERINAQNPKSSDVQLGGYGGFLVTNFTEKRTENEKSNCTRYTIKYFHGYGGGGPVTKGTIQHQREMVKTQGADLIWMGHVHEDYELTYPYETINYLGVIKHKQVMMLRTAAYKEEYGDGHSGFHVERGRPVKPLGGRWLDLNFRREGNDRLIKPLTYKTEQ